MTNELRLRIAEHVVSCAIIWGVSTWFTY